MCGGPRMSTVVNFLYLSANDAGDVFAQRLLLLEVALAAGGGSVWEFPAAIRAFLGE